MKVNVGTVARDVAVVVGALITVLNLISASIPASAQATVAIVVGILTAVGSVAKQFETAKAVAAAKGPVQG